MIFCQLHSAFDEEISDALSFSDASSCRLYFLQPLSEISGSFSRIATDSSTSQAGSIIGRLNSNSL